MASDGHPQIIVAEDAEALAEIAAERLLARVTPVRERAAVCLTGGSSPEGLYHRMAREPYRSKLPWVGCTGSWATTASCQGTTPTAIWAWRDGSSSIA